MTTDDATKLLVAGPLIAGSITLTIGFLYLAVGMVLEALADFSSKWRTIQQDWAVRRGLK